MGKVCAYLVCTGLVLLALFFIAPPNDFPIGTTVLVTRGESVMQIAASLADVGVINHPIALQAVLRLTGTDSHVYSGEYRFVGQENLIKIAYRLATGKYGLPPVRLTLFEGETVRDLAEEVNRLYPNISREDFAASAAGDEGYLFPDPCFFSPLVDAASIVQEMRANFDEHVRPFGGDIAMSRHSLSDVITLASLIEREARTSTDKRIVAGILWRRLEIGMPLQVDAVFGYIFGRGTYSPSSADLKVDSPYNTYTHTGLPPGPISNPGLESIKAALNPEETEYLYYLTGHDGLMRYAATFSVHQTNRRKYLY